MIGNFYYGKYEITPSQNKSASPFSYFSCITLFTETNRPLCKTRLKKIKLWKWFKEPPCFFTSFLFYQAKEFFNEIPFSLSLSFCDLLSRGLFFPCTYIFTKRVFSLYVLQCNYKLTDVNEHICALASTFLLISNLKD